MIGSARVLCNNTIRVFPYLRRTDRAVHFFYSIPSSSISLKANLPITKGRFSPECMDFLGLFLKFVSRVQNPAKSTPKTVRNTGLNSTVGCRIYGLYWDFMESITVSN